MKTEIIILFHRHVAFNEGLTKTEIISSFHRHVSFNEGLNSKTEIVS
jgi:hypothetical protein